LCATATACRPCSGAPSPSVASPLPETCQTFHHGEHVLYAHTSHGWHHHLRTLVESPKLRQAIGDRGRALVSEKFTRKRAAESYLQIMLDELRQPAFAKNPADLRAPRI
jgi:glycosyltransferase involved in cell wall biosynthesis